MSQAENKKNAHNHSVTRDSSCLKVGVREGGYDRRGARNSLEIKQFRGHVVICIT